MKTSRTSLTPSKIAGLLALSAVVVGCSSDDVAEAEAAAHEAVESVAAAAERATEMRRDAEDTFAEARADLDRLGERIERLSEEGEAEIAARLAQVRSEYEELEARMARLAEEGAEDVEAARRAIADRMGALREDVRELEMKIDVDTKG